MGGMSAVYLSFRPLRTDLLVSQSPHACAFCLLAAPCCASHSCVSPSCPVPRRVMDPCGPSFPHGRASTSPFPQRVSRVPEVFCHSNLEFGKTSAQIAPFLQASVFSLVLLRASATDRPARPPARLGLVGPKVGKRRQDGRALALLSARSSRSLRSLTSSLHWLAAFIEVGSNARAAGLCVCDRQRHWVDLLNSLAVHAFFFCSSVRHTRHYIKNGRRQLPQFQAQR